MVIFEWFLGFFRGSLSAVSLPISATYPAFVKRCSCCTEVALYHCTILQFDFSKRTTVFGNRNLSCAKVFQSTNGNNRAKQTCSPRWHCLHKNFAEMDQVPAKITIFEGILKICWNSARNCFQGVPKPLRKKTVELPMSLVPSQWGERRAESGENANHYRGRSSPSPS